MQIVYISIYLKKKKKNLSHVACINCMRDEESGTVGAFQRVPSANSLRKLSKLWPGYKIGVKISVRLW